MGGGRWCEVCFSIRALGWQTLCSQVSFCFPFAFPPQPLLPCSSFFLPCGELIQRRLRRSSDEAHLLHAPSHSLSSFTLKRICSPPSSIAFLDL